MRMFGLLIVCGLLFALPEEGQAAADGRDSWEVRPGAAVQLKAEPKSDAAVVGEVPSGTRGLRNMGCEGMPDLNAWLALSDTERAAAREKIWCRTKFAGTVGWLKSIDLAEPTGVAPAFDCGRAEGEVEMLLCRDSDLAKLDQEMADVYWTGMAVAATSGPKAKQAMATNKEMQRGWIKERNDCWKAPDVKICVTGSYYRRLAELEARWNLVDMAGTDTYTCSDGRVVSVARYKTTHWGAADVRTNDGSEIYVQTRTASGVKYEGPFGRFVWNKGKAAQMKLTPNEPELSCEIK